MKRKHSSVWDGAPNDDGVPGRPSQALAARWFPFFAVAFTLTVLMVGTNIPTPLYPVYADRFGFSPLVVTLIFATYSAVLMPSLLIFGPLSDVVGRRPILLFAVAASAVGAVVFAFASSTAALFLARVIQGLGVGAAQGVAAAALADAEPDGNGPRAALVASIGTAGGSALGPLLGGTLAQYAPYPTQLVYGVEIALLAAAFCGTFRGLSRGPLRGGTWRPARPSVPRSIRRAFALAGSAGFLAWAVAGLFLALMPGYVIQLTKISNLALTGSIVALMLGCSAAAQLGVRRVGPMRSQTAGLVLLLISLIGIIVAAGTASVSVIFAATIVSGVGHGLAFAGALTAVNHMAPKHRRGEIMSGFFVFCYAGVSLPVIGLGFMALAVGLVPAVALFAVVIGLACGAALAVLCHTPERG